MANEVSMNGRKKLSTLQKEFTERFNYLGLVFLDSQGSPIDVSRTLAQVRTRKGEELSIAGSLKVNTLERRFMDSYGLKVELSYSKGGVLVHTSESEYRTLKELDEWCAANGCERMVGEGNAAARPRVTLQGQIAKRMTEAYKDAFVKKIDRDNYLDIHLPSINDWKGTHIGFNTANDVIRIVFHCRDEEYVRRAVEGSHLLEGYPMGLRPKGNPAFDDAESAVEAALAFLEEVGRVAGARVQDFDHAKPTHRVKDIEANRVDGEAGLSVGDFNEMVKAYREGDLERVAELVSRGNPVLQFNGDSLIDVEIISTVCAPKVDLDALRRLISGGADVNERNGDADAYTAAHFCAWDGKEEALSILLENGAEPDVSGNDGSTPLHLAAANGHSNCVGMLIDAGAAIDRRRTLENPLNGRGGGNALRDGVLNQFWDVIELLLERGADVSILREPCTVGKEGEKDLFRVVGLMNEQGEYPNGNFDGRRLADLERRVKGVSPEDGEDGEDSSKGGGVESMGDPSESARPPVPELHEMDLPDDDAVNRVCLQTERGRCLANLLYVNRVLSGRGYETDNHQAYFFDSHVLISDRELEGFLVVNMDGFYSNCMDESEMRPIFSWGGVLDIEYRDTDDGCKIDIVAEQGRLTVRKEGTRSLKAVHSLYRHVWKEVNEEFRDQPFIEWGRVEEMGVRQVGFDSPAAYFRFEVQGLDSDRSSDSGGAIVPAAKAVDTPSAKAGDVATAKRTGEDAASPHFHVGKAYESAYRRFGEIADHTGILVNDIKAEPDAGQRDELWDITRAFVSRIYELDAETDPDRDEVDSLCFHSIVALHWCDLMIEDKRFSYTNGRFRRDTIALALCLYLRVSRDFPDYDFMKSRFVMPHMQYSVLMWTMNTALARGRDDLLGRFSVDQMQEAMRLFLEIDGKNRAAGSFGLVNPNQMPDGHPLKEVWKDLFSLFKGDSPPYAFMKSYIGAPPVGKSAFGKLFSSLNSGDRGKLVCLLEADRGANLSFIDSRMA